MMMEIAQIKRFLASYYGLSLTGEGSDYTIAVVGQVPDSEHMIPLGKHDRPTKVRIKNGFITIDPKD